MTPRAIRHHEGWPPFHFLSEPSSPPASGPPTGSPSAWNVLPVFPGSLQASPTSFHHHLPGHLSGLFRSLRPVLWEHPAPLTITTVIWVTMSVGASPGLGVTGTPQQSSFSESLPFRRMDFQVGQVRVPVFHFTSLVSTQGLFLSWKGERHSQFPRQSATKGKTKTGLPTQPPECFSRRPGVHRNHSRRYHQSHGSTKSAPSSAAGPLFTERVQIACLAGWDGNVL